MVLSFPGVGKKALWVGDDLRGELKSSSQSFAAAKKKCQSSECVRENNKVMKNTLCEESFHIKCVFKNNLLCVASVSLRN